MVIGRAGQVGGYKATPGISRIVVAGTGGDRSDGDRWRIGVVGNGCTSTGRMHKQWPGPVRMHRDRL